MILNEKKRERKKNCKTVNKTHFVHFIRIFHLIGGSVCDVDDGGDGNGGDDFYLRCEPTKKMK